MVTGTKRYSDARSPGEQLRELYAVIAYVGGLAFLSLAWALLAWAAIGNTTMHHFHYAIPNPTPGAAPYNYNLRHAGARP